MASTSAGVATHQLIQTPPVASSPVNFGAGPPREPWQSRQRKIRAWLLETAPKPAASAPSGCQRKSCSQPRRSNHSTLSSTLETLRIGVTPSTRNTATLPRRTIEPMGVELFTPVHLLFLGILALLLFVPNRLPAVSRSIAPVIREF